MSSPRRFLPNLNLPLPGVNWITGITVVMILVQVWLGSMADGNGGITDESRRLYMMFGVSWEGISQFHLWQLVTHGLIHGSWFHLSINLLMLWLLGGRVIHILGQKKFAVIMLAGVFAGGVLHVLMDAIITSGGHAGSYLVGSSGGCFALLLTLTTLSPESRMWPVSVSGKNLGLGLILAEFLLLLMTPALGVPLFSRIGEMIVEQGGAGFFVISHACHLGGAVAGWFIARKLLVPRPSLGDLQRARARREEKMEFGDAG